MVMIGIHTPETAPEHNVANVRQKMQEAGFDFPVLLDNQLRNWKAWGNTMWPTVYLIDKQGYVTFWWMGELNWQGTQGEKIMREKIENLLLAPADGSS